MIDRLLRKPLIDDGNTTAPRSASTSCIRRTAFGRSASVEFRGFEDAAIPS